MKVKVFDLGQAARDEVRKAVAEILPGAAEVVRCRDCKKAEHDTIFRQYWCRGREVDPDGYCSGGDRKDGEQNGTK